MSFSKNMIWSPIDYKDVSVLAREVGNEMLSRLVWVTLKPSVILDLGCGTGEFSSLLQARYPEAQVIPLDLSQQMIEYAKQHSVQSLCVCADSSELPLRDQS